MIYVLIEIEVDKDKHNLAYFRDSNKQFKELCILSYCDYFLMNAYKCNIFDYNDNFCDDITLYITNPLKNNYPFFLNYNFLSIVYVNQNKKIYIDENYNKEDNSEDYNDIENETNGHKIYNNTVSINYKRFNITYYIIGIIVLLRIIITPIYKYKCKKNNFLSYEKLNNKAISNNNEDESSEDSEDSSDSEKENKLIKKKFTEDLENKIIKYKKYILEEPKFNFLNCLDLTDNFLKLNEIKNEIFDETNLIELSALKLIFCYFILVNELVYNEIKGNLDENKNLKLIKSKFFFTLKFCQYSTEGYKIICGIIVGYKLLNYLYKIRKISWRKIS